MKSKLLEKIKLEVVLYFALFAILSLPRSVNEISDFAATIVNATKIACFGAIVLLALYKRIKISKVTKIFFAYFAFLGLMTYINGVDPITFLKTYSLNIAVLLLGELILSATNSKTLLKIISNYMLILLVLNLALIAIFNIIGIKADTYLLGVDNRFVLYVIPTVIGFLYLDAMGLDKNAKKKMWVAYVVGFISTIVTWSVAAFSILMIMILGTFFVSFTKKLKLNMKILCGIILVCSAALVLFRIHQVFGSVITNTLHKDITLTYRTYIWDTGLDLLFANPANLVFGFGFFNAKIVLNALRYTAARVNHFHNVLLNTTFFGGLIGLGIYVFGFFSIANQIDKIKNRFSRNQLVVVFCGLLGLMFFDSFEYYQIYYLSLFLLWNFNGFTSSNRILEAKDEKN